MTTVYYDMVGNIIRPGDLVVSSALRYKSAELRVGVVSKLLEISGKYCYCEVIRLCPSRNYKNEVLKTTNRKHKCLCTDLVVIRWNSIKEDSAFHEPLMKAKKKVMTGK